MTKKVAILVDNYFEQAEFEAPLAALKEHNVAVDIIATKQKDLTAMQHADRGSPFTADLLLEDATADDYDALVLPGGVINADHLRMDKTARQWVCDFLDHGKTIAAICHAPWLLVSADAVEGRRLTSYYTLQDDIRNAGGEWADFPVLVDHTLITSRKPDDLPDFCNALLQALDIKAPQKAM